ncbi:hypothetical protein AAVH_42809 [Aphelenchoides avenae]|nr:hypothetical protein AAVH_42809 [Aphelenchus avenae]
MRLKIAVALAVVLAELSAAVEIPLTLKHRDSHKAISRDGSVIAAAKTTRRDLSEQEGNFVINITIGTPPQPLRLLVSHDSSVTYVLGATCDTGVCPDHAKYDYTKSTTGIGYPADAKIKVGTASDTARAFPAKDDIQVCIIVGE